MNKTNTKTFTHLSYEQRKIIEFMLDNNYSFTDIANSINKYRTTISREVKERRVIYDNRNRYMASIREHCDKLNKFPYVCNGCKSRRHCRKIRYLYHAKTANDNYLNKLSISRQGIDLTEEEKIEIDKLLQDRLVKKKQSINHIIINNPNVITCSKPTLYSYINQGIFSIKNIDLLRKVKYKPRKKGKIQKVKRENKVRINRKYEDFLDYISKNPDASVVEMDTVEGIKGGKVFLTLSFRKSKLMLMYLLDSKSIDDVIFVFDNLKTLLGIKTFKKLFEVILTDNGSEFLDPESIEFDQNSNEILSRVFYCDPYASWQKGTCEKNHEFIRYILPKKSSFDSLTQNKTYIISSNINNTSRSILENKTPYEFFKFQYDVETLDKLNIYYISHDNVNLSKNIIK